MVTTFLKKQKVKVALCLPWYAGADRDCVTHFLQFQHYLGRLQERLSWIAQQPRGFKIGDMPKLDPANTTGFSEIHPDLWGTEIEFGVADEIGCSLPGLARERCADNALAWGADYLLYYDADMIFGTDLFLRLLMARKPMIGALAFTGREPVTPVIYNFKDFKFDKEVSFTSEPIFEYPRDQVAQVDAIGGGVFLVDADVFRSMAKPWFATQSALGEDIYFCARCKMQNIPVHVHTGAKTLHKPTFPQVWHCEDLYFQQNPHLHSKKSEELALKINGLGSHVWGTGVDVVEGSSTMPELLYLSEQASTLPRNARICEVGFNMGMSSLAMLEGNSTATITCFDEGKWSCVEPAKKYIDDKYPGRHKLVFGDTKDTLKKLNGDTFDLAFIDGGHDYETATSDIKLLAPRSRRVIVDDLQVPDVKKAWDEAISAGLLRPISEHSDDLVVGTKRRWAAARGGLQI